MYARPVFLAKDKKLMKNISTQSKTFSNLKQIEPLKSFSKIMIKKKLFVENIKLPQLNYRL